MKIKTILKIILILAIVTKVCTMPINTFAATGDATNLDSFWDDWEDGGSLEDLNDGSATPTPTSTPTQVQTTPTPTKTSTSTPTPTSTVTTGNQYNTNIPKAGLVEDTMMIVAVLVLVVTAIYAFKKLSDYSNI